jgi:TP901 family phage tail tape measure protein
MAKQIKSNEIYEKDIFQNLIKSADESIKKLELMNEEFVKMAGTIKKAMSGAKFNTTKELNEFVKSTKEATKVSEQQAKALQQIQKLEALKLKTEQELEKVNQQKIKTQTAQNKEAERQAKAQQKSVKLANDEANAYKKLEKNTRELKNESKRLGAELLNLELSGKKNSKAYRDLEAQYRKVTRSAQQGDAQLKKLDQTVGDNFRNVGNYKSALNGVRNALSQLGLAFGVFQGIKSSFNIIKDFDQAQGDLQAISGKTKDELAGLTQQAKDLGATTQFSATQITEMQIELAKLGFTSEQITQSTEAVSNFASATGVEIARASALAGAGLRMFNLDASEMERVVSVLGVATTKTALDFSKLETGLSTVGPVAQSFGFSIEDTTALLGQLANSGFDASSSATALRNILLNLADSNGALAVELGKPITSADDLAGALKELQNRGIDLASALELTDKRSVSAFNTFIQGSGDLVELRDSITDVNDELKAMAEKRLDTISGQFTLLQSAWEGFILSVNEGSGVGNTIKSLLSFLAKNLPNIIGWISKLAIGYGVLLVKTKLLNGSFGNLGRNILGLVTGTQKLNSANIMASRSAQALGRAMKSIGFVAVIGLAVDLAKALYDVASGAYEAEYAQKVLAKAQDEADRTATNRITQRQKNLEKEISNLQRLRNENKITEEELLKQKESNIKKTKEQIKNDIKQVETTNKSVEEQIKKFKELSKRVKYYQDSSGKTITIEQKISELNAQISGGNVKIEEYNKELENINENLKDATSEIIVNKNAFKLKSEEDKKNKKTTKELNTEYSEINKVISEQTRLLNELNKIYFERQTMALDVKTEEEFKRQLYLAETTGEANVDLFESYLFEANKLRVEYAKQNTLSLIQQQQEDFENEKKQKQKELDEEREKLLSQKGLTQKAKDEINDNYLEKQKELDGELETLAKDNELKKKIIAENGANELLEIEKDKNDKINDYNDQINDALGQYGEGQTKQAEKEAKDKLDKQKEYYKRVDELAKLSADYFIKQSQKKIEQIDKEINALNQQKSFLEQLAVEGNLTAEKSLAQNEKMLAEANKKKEQELKKQERIKLAESVFSTYIANLENKEGNALVKTISDISVLTSFINSLPTFYEGTETTVGEALGSPQMQGKDGYIVRVDGSEKVLNPELSKMTGSLTTYEIAKISSDYLKNKNMINGAQSLQINQFNDGVLIKKIDELNATIKNKPETNIEMGEIVGGVIHLIESQRKGKDVTRNIRRFK